MHIIMSILSFLLFFSCLSSFNHYFILFYFIFIFYFYSGDNVNVKKKKKLICGFAQLPK